MNLLVLVLLVSVVHYDMGAQVFNCPSNQIKFEKLIGLKPNQFQTNTLLYRGKNNVPITLDCLQTCIQDTKCSSFVLYYNSSECYAYLDSTVKIQTFDYDSRPLTDVAWFRKICDINPSCDKGWIFETVAGADFIGYDTKYVGNITRQNCIRSCINEPSFSCRSIKFYVADKTNVDSVGTCTLSEMDRHLIPNSFRVSRYENEYIENQCVHSSSFDPCAYEEYANSTLKHVDLQLATSTEDQCRNNCDTLRSFNCRGYSIISARNEVDSRESYNCILHSEDTKLVGPKLLVNFPGGKYYEKALCLNVSALCNDKFMTITYMPEQPFTGRIYTNGFSDTAPCFADGKFRAPIMLELPLGQNKCGLIEERSTMPNRTLRSVLLVIQYNALIQTQVDRYVKIGCALGDGRDEITVGTNINFTNSHPPGSTIINNSSVLPMVTIRVVDYDTKLPTRETDIGQELQLIIDIKPATGPYDIWAGHLVATSENGQDSILLLDDKGCPTQSEIFQPFTKIVTSSSRMLVSTFQAFKFTSSSVVRFTVMVHFCTLTCPPLNCSRNARPRRETHYIYNNATVVPVNKTNDTYLEIMPLDIILLVRGSLGKSDQLIIGRDNKILLAGSDWLTNEVCVDYALFVGLAACWILLQIIILVCCFFLIRKYKKYFDIAYTRHLDDQTFSDTHQSFGLGGENLNRRVRWADQ